MAQDLPMEILGEIFVFCLQNPNIDDPSDMQPKTDIPPLLLCRICRSWRNAAFATPHLWRELTVELRPISIQSYLDSVLFKTIKLWNSCRGALPPSLHFRAHSFRNQNERKSIPFETIFQHCAISNAEALTLSKFSLREFITVSKLLQKATFSNLQFLSITQPWRKEHDTDCFRFTTCPNLRRLHFDCNTQTSSNPGRIVTLFCWRTLTHFRADLNVRLSDWYIILEQCVNLSCGIFSLTLTRREPFRRNRDIVYHHNLKTLSIRGIPKDLIPAVDGFIFPSITSLRIYSIHSLETIHALLSTTPTLEELYLHECRQFNLSDFLVQPHNPSSTGPLSKFAPQLRVLVIDLGRYVLTEDLHTLLHSGWLNDGWSYCSTRKSVEFFLYEDPFGSLNTFIPYNMDPSVFLNFRVSGRRIRGDFRRRLQPTAADLRDRWDDLFTFYV